ncbi:MAG TPA: ABC transporter permease [Candidatus Limnocylindria bacterium]|nr:ABC transporter permease [Candidatus Limnocylindria bacterium]
MAGTGGITLTAAGSRERREGLFGAAGTVLLELVGWRHLALQLVRAELTRENARLVLGSIWWIADPLLQMLVYTLLVSVIFQRTIVDYPLFVLAALIPWKGLATSISSGGTAVIGNERIVRQLPFPRIVLPAARLLAQFWRLGVALVVLVVLMAILWPARLSPAIAWLPVLGAAQMVMLLPFVIILSAATVFVRDLSHLIGHLMRLAMYLSPVLYGFDQLAGRLPDSLVAIYRLSPLAALLEGYRDVAYRATAPGPDAILLPIGIGLIALPFALAWFRRVEPGFVRAL